MTIITIIVGNLFLLNLIQVLKGNVKERFPKEVTLCQQAPKDLVTELRKAAYFPKSK